MRKFVFTIDEKVKWPLTLTEWRTETHIQFHSPQSVWLAAGLLFVLCYQIFWFLTYRQHSMTSENMAMD